MANIYQSGGKVAGKLMSKLTELASDLVSKGKTSAEIRETLSQKVPGATPSQIDEAIAPTLLSKVEKGKELMVVEPGMARPVQPELSTETGLVPTGRGRTTFIAGEEGISAGGQSPMGPIPIKTEARTVEERIRSANAPKAEPVTRPEAARPSIGTARKVGAGMVAAGAVGKALGGGEEKGEEKPLPVYNVNPKITDEGKLEFSPGELEAANSRGGSDEVRRLWNTYEDLNRQIEERPLVGSRSDVNIKVQRAQDYLSELRAMATPNKEATRPTSQVPLVLEPGKFAPLLGLKEGPAPSGQPTPTKEATSPKTTVTERIKEKKAATPTPPGGIAAKQRPQPKTIAESITSQVKTAETAQDAASAITDKLAAGQQLTRADMLGLVKKINSIQPTPAQADDATVKALRAAREEARQAYREQANRNEWYEVAQTVSNAVANFIAAQRGLAGRPLTLPQVDYGERTARALREYQTELGAITEQERALERGVERKQAAAEREAEASRRGWERYLMLGERQIEAAERKAAQDQDLATRLKIATAQQEQEKAKLDAAAKKEEKKAAQEGGKEQLSFLEKSIRQTEDLIKDTETKLKNATAVASATDSKAFSEALPAYSLGAGVDLSQYSKAGILSGEKYQQDEVKKQARGRASELSLELQRLAKIRDEKLNQYDTLLSGGQPTRPAAPSGQEPAAGGKVISKAEVANYAKNQGATPEQAASFLTGQGYTIQD